MKDTNRLYLDIKYEEKDKAKGIAAAFGGSINWDQHRRKWYWVGTGNIPEALLQYEPELLPQRYLGTRNPPGPMSGINKRRRFVARIENEGV